jgi:hypothetical protein
MVNEGSGLLAFSKPPSTPYFFPLFHFQWVFFSRREIGRESQELIVTRKYHNENNEPNLKLVFPIWVSSVKLLSLCVVNVCGCII